MRDLAYVALGSNLGDRDEYLAMARRELARLPRTRVLATTDVEETPPFGPVEQGPFLNQMIELETELSPRELLKELHRIERLAGRVRDARWGPRTLDLDIVAFERQRIVDGDVAVPHPGVQDRDFWQRELRTLRGARGLDFLGADEAP